MHWFLERRAECLLSSILSLLPREWQGRIRMVMEALDV
jgi:hypothetical protein